MLIICLDNFPKSTYMFIFVQIIFIYGTKFTY